jgi:hypothetical protein
VLGIVGEENGKGNNGQKMDALTAMLAGLRRIHVGRANRDGPELPIQ